MGNGQSTIKAKEERLWSEWTAHELEKLKQICDDNNSLPEYFNKDLADGIIRTMAHKQKASTVEYLEFLHGLLKTQDKTSIYFTFRQICIASENKMSLQMFVHAVVQSAIPLWFEGSSYQWSKDLEDTEKLDLLVCYMLNHTDEKAKQATLSMAWLDLDNRDENKTIVEEDSNWQELATSLPSTITEAEFIQWIENTPGFCVLFQLTVEYILFGSTYHATKQTNDKALHKRRLAHLMSPRIQKHDSLTRRLFGDADRFSGLLTPYDYFLLSLSLPSNALSWSDYERTQRKVLEDLQHTLLFSTQRDGNSWQVFVSKMVKQGATFVVIKTKDGDVFGGYADDAWEYPPSTTWYGHSANFLFRLNKAFGVWDGANSSNDHYQYLCWGKKSLPNGFGMGGQFDYAGLWIDADFHNGHSRAGPLCTTYSSPQLSEKDKFIVDEIEVWLVRPLQRDEDEDLAGGNGILGRSEDMEFMEMAGKKMYSKDLAPVRTEDVVADDGGS